MGLILPFTVTVSICLNYSMHFGVKYFFIIPLIKIYEPNYLVAASSLDAIFTLGEI